MSKRAIILFFNEMNKPFSALYKQNYGDPDNLGKELKNLFREVLVIKDISINKKQRPKVYPLIEMVATEVTRKLFDQYLDYCFLIDPNESNSEYINYIYEIRVADRFIHLTLIKKEFTFGQCFKSIEFEGLIKDLTVDNVLHLRLVNKNNNL